jgi:hypothetical protein
VNDGLVLSASDVAVPRASDVVVPAGKTQRDRGETVPGPEQAKGVADSPSDPQAGATDAAGVTISPRSGRRWFPAFCALIAVAAAAAALAAPWLRPQLDNYARQWLGDSNLVSRVIMPDPATAPAVVARAVAEDVLRGRLTVYDQRIQAMAQSLDTMHSELAQAIAALRASTANNAALSGAIDGLSQRTDQLQSTGAALEARARAASVLALAVGLRRNIDAGMPIQGECAALKATGMLPGPVSHALQELTRISTGIPTMRDLGDGFDAVQAKLAYRSANASTGTGLMRLGSLFGFGEASTDDVLLDHLRTLAAEGRFSEAAKVLQTSDAGYLGTDWIAMVQTRATAVIATQVILTHALQAMDAAYAANDGAIAQKPTE